MLALSQIALWSVSYAAFELFHLRYLISTVLRLNHLTVIFVAKPAPTVTYCHVAHDPNDDD